MTRPRQTATHVSVDQLMAHPDNIRDGLGDLTDLARSIQEHGILQPLTVTEHAGDSFLILAGHRRFRAGLKVGLTSFPVIVRHGLDDHAEQLVVMLVENTQRRDLDPIEKSKAFQALLAEGLSQSEIARRVGCKPSTVNYYCAFLDLDEEPVQAVRDGRLTAQQAREGVVAGRQSTRASAAKPRRGRRPDYFGRTHALYATVRGLCDHGDRPVIGAAGCGQCWEQAIVEAFVATHAAAAS